MFFQIPTAKYIILLLRVINSLRGHCTKRRLTGKMSVSRLAYTPFVKTLEILVLVPYFRYPTLTAVFKILPFTALYYSSTPHKKMYKNNNCVIII